MARWISPLDVFIWKVILVFFLYFAVRSGGDIGETILASLGVILVMTVIGISIETIINVFQNIRGLGTILGFLTNGPEMVVLVVGIIVRDPLFGVSTPLGSNIINPLMLILAAITTGTVIRLVQVKLIYGALCIFFTVGLALAFYFIPVEFYLWWIVIAAIGTFILFSLRPKEEKREERSSDIPKWVVAPALILLIIAGYFLDPVVEHAGVVSGVPKNIVGFLVLATLSSWPEFKSCVVLFREGFIGSASNNIFVSNITNIWLAIIGILFYLY